MKLEIHPHEERNARGYWDKIAETLRVGDVVTTPTHNEALALVIAMKKIGQKPQHQTKTNTIKRIK